MEWRSLKEGEESCNWIENLLKKIFKKRELRTLKHERLWNGEWMYWKHGWFSKRERCFMNGTREKNRFTYIFLAFSSYTFNFCCLLVVFPCFAELLTLKRNCIMGMKICWVSKNFIYRWNAIIKIDRICMRRRWQPIHSSRIGECNMILQIHWFSISEAYHVWLCIEKGCHSYNPDV